MTKNKFNFQCPNCNVIFKKPKITKDGRKLCPLCSYEFKNNSISISLTNNPYHLDWDNYDFNSFMIYYGYYPSNQASI